MEVGQEVVIHSPLSSAPHVTSGTHAVIDRYRLANYACRLKNTFWFGPGREESDPDTGYAKSTPIHIKFWLVVIIDNTIHLTINHLALRFLN